MDNRGRKVSTLWEDISSNTNKNKRQHTKRLRTRSMSAKSASTWEHKLANVLQNVTKYQQM
jgi:hypothetical protein